MEMQERWELPVKKDHKETKDPLVKSEDQETKVLMVNQAHLETMDKTVLLDKRESLESQEL